MATNFYKISVANKSFLRVSNSTFDSILGLLLYVSGSTLSIDGQTTFRNTVNDDNESALVSIDTSTVSIVDSNFSGIHSTFFSPIFNF